MPKNNLTAEQALKQLRPTLIDLPRESIRDPAIPASSMVAEGHALALLADKHLDKLEAVGVPRKLIHSLSLRAQALSGAQAILDNVRGRKRTTAELEHERHGQQLRSDIITAGRFALRTNDKAQSVLDKILEGTGLDDLVQDLFALARFASTYSEELTHIGENPAALQKDCEKTANALQAAVVARRIGDDEETSALALRNRAATHLWDAISEVRTAGVYAFRRDPELQRLFRSAYRSRHRSAKSGTPEGSATPNPTA